MAIHRKIFQLRIPLLLGVAIATAPFTTRFSGMSFGIVQQAAFAKSGNNGKGGGGSSEGNSKSESRGNSNSRETKDKGAKTKSGEAALSVRHDDGMSEVVRNGRYIMKDAKGRTIINRKATLGDEIRLKFFSR